MRLLQQPGDGVMPLISAINGAKKTVEIAIFRFDQREVERALARAVGRGVAVHALIAHVNSSGEESLRKLEMRLLAAGVTVARTGGDFVRYHYKLLIVDRSELFLLAFNFTGQDINRSRSFGLVIDSKNDDRKLIEEAYKLFEADTKRQAYEPGLPNDRSPGFVVSPVNAREQLAAFIQGAKTELLIYDPKISDPAMLGLLKERCKASTVVKVIGQVSAASGLMARRLTGLRLHARVIIRDRQAAFVGSQSLRELELDGRREAGIIFEDLEIVNRLAKTFDEDWELAQSTPEGGKLGSAARVAKRIAKVVTKELPPLAPALEAAIQEIGGDQDRAELDASQIEETVKAAVKEAVKEAVEEIVEEAKQHA